MNIFILLSLLKVPFLNALEFGFCHCHFTSLKGHQWLSNCQINLIVLRDLLTSLAIFNSNLPSLSWNSLLCWLDDIISFWFSVYLPDWFSSFKPPNVVFPKFCPISSNTITSMLITSKSICLALTLFLRSSFALFDLSLVSHTTYSSYLKMNSFYLSSFP